MTAGLHLVSHALCPYAQRVAIVAAEKSVPLERTLIDLAAKPAWFLALSPTGKVPLLQVRMADGTEHALFESAAICEYLDETGPRPSLLPVEPLARARHRAWIEMASATLADIHRLYVAPDADAYEAAAAHLGRRFRQLGDTIAGPWFDGAVFGVVDAAFAPVFRYLDAFERRVALRLADGIGPLTAWRARLAARVSVIEAVAPDYPERLADFLRTRDSHLGRLMPAASA